MSQELWELCQWGVTPGRFNLGLRGGTRRNPASGPLGWGLGVGVTTPPHKNKPCYRNYITTTTRAPIGPCGGTLWL